MVTRFSQEHLVVAKKQLSTATCRTINHDKSMQSSLTEIIAVNLQSHEKAVHRRLNFYCSSNAI